MWGWGVYQDKTLYGANPHFSKKEKNEIKTEKNKKIGKNFGKRRKVIIFALSLKIINLNISYSCALSL